MLPGLAPSVVAALDPFLAHVTALLHFDGADGSTVISDSSKSGLTISRAGNAQIDTAQSRFGGASVLFDGTGDYIYCDTAAGFVMTGDFTFEFWMRHGGTQVSSQSEIALVDFRAALTAEPCVYLDKSSTQLIFLMDTAVVATSYAVAANQWHHVAVARQGSVNRFFLNGGQVGSDYISANAWAAPRLTIGSFGTQRNTTNAYHFTGWIDEFRFTSGVPRYVAGFLPPDRAFPSN